MSKKVLVVAAALLFAVCAWAGTASKMQTDLAGQVVPVISPRAIWMMSGTKGSFGYNQSYASRLRIQPTAAVMMRYSGSSASWPIAANAIIDIGVNHNARSHIKFDITSSATPTRVYVLDE